MNLSVLFCKLSTCTPFLLTQCYSPPLPLSPSLTPHSLQDGSTSIATATLHPHAIGLLGQQGSLCVGLSGGIIIKHNLHRTSSILGSGALGSRLAIAPSEPLDPVDPDSTPSATARAAAAAQENGDGVTPRRGDEGGLGAVKREFFQAHGSTILHIGFVGNVGNDMVTVDTLGHIFLWPYTLDQFSGFGWFVPSKKFRLQLDVAMYTPDQSGEYVGKGKEMERDGGGRRDRGY